MKASARRMIAASSTLCIPLPRLKLIAFGPLTAFFSARRLIRIIGSLLGPLLLVPRLPEGQTHGDGGRGGHPVEEVGRKGALRGGDLAERVEDLDRGAEPLPER